MNTNIFLFLVFSNILFGITIRIPDFLDREERLREATMSTVKKITNNLYAINYYNDYYLENILSQGEKNIEQLMKIVINNFGEKYNFDIRRLNSFACSSFNVKDNENHNLFGRNFDYPSSPTLVVWTRPKNGLKSISFVHGAFFGFSDGGIPIKDRYLLSPYGPMDGMNEAGVSISVLYLNNPSTHQDNPTLKDITTSIMIRGVLDNCRNVLDAVSFFKKYNMHDAIQGASYHFMITDSRGDAVVIEYIDNKINVIRPDRRYNSDYLFVTNFCLTKLRDRATCPRYNTMKEYLKVGVKMEINDAMNLLNKVRLGSTIWSNVYDTNNLTVTMAYRKDYSKLYEFIIHEPQRVKIKYMPN